MNTDSVIDFRFSHCELLLVFRFVLVLNQFGMERKPPRVYSFEDFNAEIIYSSELVFRRQKVTYLVSFHEVVVGEHMMDSAKREHSTSESIEKEKKNGNGIGP